jgi:hypothetical protein
MLRGAIDLVSGNEVGGWIYSSTGSLRDHTVLAYIHDVCVGAGRVDVFRQDLANAGLGDGFLGFKFPVSLSKLEEASLVSVKLEGSDAVIMQSGARLALRAPALQRTIVTMRTLGSIDWMRARGWLDQAEYDFLRLMFRFGVYDFNLSKSKPQERRNGGGLRDPQEAAREMFELLCAESKEAATDVLTQATGLGPLLDRFHGGSIEPIVSLWSPQSARISLLEGSHLDTSTSEPDSAITGAVDYVVGADRLLFLDLRCRLTWQFEHQVRCYSMKIG